ncbi:Serine/threonine-protein kinase ssp1 [Porphyridium purpureum]|uniref:Serine/threonine-protein kinase ssp1 n=1 Tax=Porphyridium purpureum TaxID=35688 RepID=A0A5J4YJI7_PORPP|nr:Serine/threonine-protein kinase ssp1 [Porphyridium purpureum]|eukprot:POR2974..scf210_14
MAEPAAGAAHESDSAEYSASNEDVARSDSSLGTALDVQRPDTRYEAESSAADAGLSNYATSPATRGNPDTLKSPTARSSGRLPPKNRGKFFLNSKKSSDAVAEPVNMLSLVAANAEASSQDLAMVAQSQRTYSTPSGVNPDDSESIGGKAIRKVLPVLGPITTGDVLSSSRGTVEDLHQGQAPQYLQQQPPLPPQQDQHSQSGGLSARSIVASSSNKGMKAAMMNRAEIASMQQQQQQQQQLSPRAAASVGSQNPTSTTQDPLVRISSAGEPRTGTIGSGGAGGTKIRQGRTSLFAGIDMNRVLVAQPDGTIDAPDAVIHSAYSEGNVVRHLSHSDRLSKSARTRSGSVTVDGALHDDEDSTRLHQVLGGSMSASTVSPPLGSRAKSKKTSFANAEGAPGGLSIHSEGADGSAPGRSLSKILGSFSLSRGISRAKSKGDFDGNAGADGSHVNPGSTSHTALAGNTGTAGTSEGYGLSRTRSRSRTRPMREGGSRRNSNESWELLRDKSLAGVLAEPESVLQTKANKMMSIATLRKDMSFFECVLYTLRGSLVTVRRGTTRFSKALPNEEVLLYVSELMDSVCTSGTPTQAELNIPLLAISKCRLTGSDMIFEAVDESFDFAFSSKNAADIWASAMSCLVPSSSLMKSRVKDMQQLESYNMFLDTYHGTSLFKLERCDNFILLDTLGSGANSVVRLALSIEDRMFFAMKTIRKSSLRKQTRTNARDSGERKQLHGLEDNREIAVMRKLGHHPNLVQMKHAMEDHENDSIHIVLEYMPGGTIMDASKSEGAEPLSESMARDAFLDVLAGLEHMHENHMLHRDLKPENLLKKCSGVVKISDFGSAKLSTTSESFSTDVAGKGTQAGIGTPAFAAPELCLSPHAPEAPPDGYAADVWSLGATLFYMVFGRVPFPARSTFEMYERVCTAELDFPNPADGSAGVSGKCLNLLTKLLTKEPLERPRLEEVWQHEWVLEALENENCRHRERMREVLAVGDASLEGDRSGTTDVPLEP